MSEFDSAARDAPEQEKKAHKAYGEWITDDGLAKIKKWCENGLSKKEIAGKMGISYSTFVRWTEKYDDIKNIIEFSAIKRKEGKQKAKQKNLLIEKHDKLEQILQKMDCKCSEIDKLETHELCLLVELSLLKRAIGYDYTEERTEYTDKTGEKTVKTQKHAPPDTSAQMLWLKHFGGLAEKPQKEEIQPVKFDINISVAEE